MCGNVKTSYGYFSSVMTLFIFACSRYSQPYSQSGSSDVASRYDFYIATSLFCCFSCAVYKAVLVACNLE